jgi:hypothetical protein
MIQSGSMVSRPIERQDDLHAPRRVRMLVHEVKPDIANNQVQVRDVPELRHGDRRDDHVSGCEKAETSACASPVLVLAIRIEFAKDAVDSLDVAYSSEE